MPFSHYSIGPKALAEFSRRLEGASPHVRDSFMVLLEHLGNDPFTTRGVLPLMDPRVPGGYTAVFDGGMVSYQVMADQPWIQLIALILNDF